MHGILHNQLKDYFAMRTTFQDVLLATVQMMIQMSNSFLIKWYLILLCLIWPSLPSIPANVD